MQEQEASILTEPYWIEPARPEDRAALNALMRASKAQWGYPQAAMDHWAEALSMSEADMESHAIYLLRAPEGHGVSGLLGAYAYRPTVERQVELEALFVAPDAKGRGIGRALLEDFLAGARQAAYERVRVISDPHAAPFYAHFGFRRLAGEAGAQAAPAPGLPQERTLPVLEKPLHPLPGTLHGDRIDLCPMDPSDLRHAHTWMVHSNLSPDWIGAPHFPDRSKPDWPAFQERYAAMVDGHPETGQGFRIEHEHQPVGVILHGPLDQGGSQTARAEDQPVWLEAWMADFRLTRRGYGSDAVLRLCRQLRQEHDIQRFCAYPSSRQESALRMLAHLGFREQQQRPAGLGMPYRDTQPMLAEWPLHSF